MSTFFLRVVGIVAIALVMRPPVTSVGPVLPEIRADLGLGSLAAGFLMTLPVVCFGTGAFLGPSLIRRLGRERLVAVLLFVLAVVLAARLVDGPIVLYAGTILVGLAIAVSNVVVPAIVKQDFPRHIGLMTGIYTGVLAIAAALAAAISAPIAHSSSMGWRAALGVWALVALVAFFLWFPQVRGARADPTARTVRPTKLLASPVAWAVTLFFGLQSLGFYAMVAWLPTILQDRGFAPAQAGLGLSLLAVIGVPFGLVLPARAAARANQVGATVFVTAVSIVGTLGIWLALPWPYVWIIILGIGQGMAFPLALTLVALRSSTVEITGQLSAMTQGIGYLVAALGPIAMGAAFAVTQSWNVSLLLLMLVLIGMLIAGIVAGRARTLG